MKCKKLFAILLSLCMIASAFVAVSAEEQYYVVGEKVELLSVAKTNDSEAEGLEIGADASSPEWIKDAEKETNVMHVSLKGTSKNSTVGVKLTGAYVPELRIGDTVSFSIDLKSDTEFKLESGNTTYGFMIRDLGSASQFSGSGPSGTFEGLVADKVLGDSNWKTFEGEYKLTKDFTGGKDIYLYIRTNKAVANLYIDNFNVTVSGYRINLGGGSADCDSESTSVLCGSNVTGVSNVTDGDRKVMKATINSTGAESTFGVLITDENDDPVKKIKAGEIVTYSVDIKPTNKLTFPSKATTLSDTNKLNGACLRGSGTTDRYYPDGAWVNVGSKSVAAEAGVWTTIAAECVMPVDLEAERIYMLIRPNVAPGVIYIDNFKVKVESRPDWYPAEDVAVDKSENMDTTIADKTVTMNIVNNSEMKYKLSGTLFIAEYNGNQLVQFASEPLAETTLAADQNVPITASFVNAPAPGNTVKAFLWDTATLAPHYFAPDVQ